MVRYGWSLATSCRISFGLRWCGQSRNRMKNFNMAVVCIQCKPKYVSILYRWWFIQRPVLALTLKSGLEVTQGHWEWCNSKALVYASHSNYGCIVSRFDTIHERDRQILHNSKGRAWAQRRSEKIMENLALASAKPQLSRTRSWSLGKFKVRSHIDRCAAVCYARTSKSMHLMEPFA